LWRELEAFAEAYVGVPFAWGHNDCFVFVSRWALLRCGVDPRRLGVTRYRNQAEAYRRGREAGFGTVASLMSAVLPETQSATPGDIVLLDDAAHRIGALGIFIDSESSLTISPDAGLCVSGAGYTRAWSCHGQ
jgi:hypothetical protein